MKVTTKQIIISVILFIIAFLIAWVGIMYLKGGDITDAVLPEIGLPQTSESLPTTDVETMQTFTTEKYGYTALYPSTWKYISNITDACTHWELAKKEEVSLCWEPISQDYTKFIESKKSDKAYAKFSEQEKNTKKFVILEKSLASGSKQYDVYLAKNLVDAGKTKPGVLALKLEVPKGVDAESAKQELIDFIGNLAIK